MLYQLPNGKVIRISTEQYLDLTDDDIAYLCNPGNNHGVHINSLWTGSVLKSNKKKKEIQAPTDDDHIISTSDDEESFYNNHTQTEEYLDDYPEAGEDIVDESTELD